jgi:lysyl-tRNA synthetase, class II
MRRIESMIEFVAQETLGTTKTTFKGNEIDLKAPWQRVKLVDELKEFDLWTKDYADLKQRLESRAVDVSNDKTWSQLVDKAVTAYVEPRLIEPTILYDYPIELSPFARVTDDDPEIVERFEFFVGGMELGNAFSELNDAEEQEQRFAMQAEEGAEGNPEAEQGDPDYVEALAYGMPPTGGLGLGIDRLAMVLAGKDSVRDVILFPAQRQKD